MCPGMFQALATSLIGRLDEFDTANDSVDTYAERVQLFFEANDIADDKQTAVFLSLIKVKMY